MCMPTIAFGGELQIWAYLSGKTAGDKIEEYLETLLTETESLSRSLHRRARCRTHGSGPVSWPAFYCVRP